MARTGPATARCCGPRQIALLVLGLTILSFVLLLSWVLGSPTPQGRSHPSSLGADKRSAVNVQLAPPPPPDSLLSRKQTGEKQSVTWWGGTIERPAPVPLEKSSYPSYLDLHDVVTSWNPDNPDPPSLFRETLAHFNYSNLAERAMAEQYRNAELPFKVYDVPDFDAVSRKWDDSFLSREFRKLGSVHVERSDNNHFMYWTMKGGREPEGYIPPTEIIDDMDFDEWVKLAHKADATKVDNATEHFYLMASSSPGDRGRVFIARDLKLFSTPEANFFITRPHANKGIQCRLSMRGVISEAHYDSGRNMVAMLRGVKRYILNPPSACPRLKLIADVNHPSYRHSVIDWSDPAQAKRAFEGVPALDTLLRVGEVLYIPTGWNHYIISLMYSMQCNSRSGSPPNGEGLGEIEKCMGRPLPRSLGGGGRGGGGRAKSGRSFRAA